MGTICVLKTVSVESSLQEPSRGRSSCRPISLLAFLQAENRRLQNTVRDTMALREALQNN